MVRFFFADLRGGLTASTLACQMTSAKSRSTHRSSSCQPLPFRLTASCSARPDTHRLSRSTINGRYRNAFPNSGMRPSRDIAAEKFPPTRTAGNRSGTGHRPSTSTRSALIAILHGPLSSLWASRFQLWPALPLDKSAFTACAIYVIDVHCAGENSC